MNYYKIIKHVKIIIRKSCNIVFGSRFRAHRVPFGPISGKYIYIKPSISPRMFFGIGENSLIRHMRSIVKRDDIVYDIGAHIGYITVLCASKVGSYGHVHCFELMPGTAEKLRKTIELNGFRNCSVHTIGLSDRNMEIDISLGDTYMGKITSFPDFLPENRIQKCFVTLLDHYVKKQSIEAPALIKMDIEGEEVRALKGALKTIGSSLPILAIEFHSLPLLNEGMKLMSDIGYSVMLLSGQPVTYDYLNSINKFHQNVICFHNNTSWHRDRLEFILSKKETRSSYC